MLAVMFKVLASIASCVLLVPEITQIRSRLYLHAVELSSQPRLSTETTILLLFDTIQSAIMP